MFPMSRNLGRALGAMLASSLLSGLLFAQSGNVSLRGQVTDPSGAIVPAVTVTAVAADGTTHETQTDGEGRYTFRNLPPSTYTVRIQLKGFADFEKPGVVVESGRPQVVDAQLVVFLEKLEVTVQGESSEVSVSPTSNVGALVLRGNDLQALSDNPDDLADELQALAGPAAGPNGGQIYIDGFTGGTLPPKESIREVRVNASPFAAEYDRLGFGRIEIFTKPGTDQFHGQGSFEIGDDIFNSRNPFALDKPPYQSRDYDFNVGGPLGKKASFFLDFGRRDTDDVSLVNALVLDPSYNVVPFNETVLNPSWRTSFSPRLDYQLTPRNTLVARYRFSRGGRRNSGPGGFDLPSQASDSVGTDQTFQITETALVSDRVVNETRFQYSRGRDSREADNSEPTIRVLDAFTDGGVSSGPSRSNQDDYELQNLTSITHHSHLVRFGGRLRDTNFWDSSVSGYNGTYLFTSLDAYRLTLEGLANGLTPEEIRAMGGGASQFSISGGEPISSINQYDVGLFLQDDWRVRSNLSLSMGLRYETQNHIGDHLDFAPRFGLAWGIGRDGRTPKMVLRAGAGIFYDRVSENLTLQAMRQNGVVQQQYLITDPDFFPLIPSTDILQGNEVPQTIRRVAPNLVSPYTIQSAIGIERQLPKNITLAVTYTNSRGVHMLRSRNINAPLPGTYDPNDPTSGERPLGIGENVYQYESAGIFNQNQLIANFNARVNPGLTLFGFYTLNRARSNSDGAGSFPANQYDLTSEYGRAGFDTRQRVFMGGSVALPFGFRINPFMMISTGRPFNITLGRDLNGDSLYNDRPAFATDLTRPSVVETAYGAFDTDPLPGAVIIPRNYGQSPDFFNLNMRLTKTFAFGKGERAEGSGGGGFRGGGHRRGPPGGGLGPGGLSGGGGRPGWWGSGGGSGRYSLEFTVDVRNLFNTVNLATPVGNLNSSLFGQSRDIAGFRGGATANRRVEFQVRFRF